MGRRRLIRLEFAKLAALVFFWAALFSPAFAELACFDGPHLDHEDRQFAYWTYTNHCNSPVTLNYEIEIEGEKPETGTTSAAACQDGSLIDSKGQYLFEVLPAEGARPGVCASKNSQSDSDSSDELSGGRPRTGASRGQRNSAAAGDAATSPGYETGPGTAGDSIPGGQEEGGQRESGTSQLGTAPGPNRCWLQSSVRSAKLICCASLQLCERTCVHGAKGNGASSCHAACSGTIERAPAGLTCYWQH